MWYMLFPVIEVPLFKIKCLIWISKVYLEVKEWDVEGKWRNVIQKAEKMGTYDGKGRMDVR